MSDISGQGGTLSFEQLFWGIDYQCVQGSVSSLKTAFKEITADSRTCSHHSVFVAIAGSSSDGHKYFDMAVEKGATLLVAQKGHDYIVGKRETVVVEVDDTRRVYAALAANWYGNPADSLILIGVTGTNGKTTITYLLEDVLKQFNKSVGVIGTIDYRWTDKNGEKHCLDAKRTTPDALELQALMRRMVDGGVEYVVMEVSSHALDQHRIGELRFQVAAFTNLSHDHLDYHQTLEAYWQAKSKLFTEHLAENGTAVITQPLEDQEMDAKWAAEMLSFCRQLPQRTVECSSNNQAEISLQNYTFNLDQSELHLLVYGESCVMVSPLVGKFNIENLLTTLGVAQSLGLPVKEVVSALAQAQGAPGRLQRIQQPHGFDDTLPQVFVDYAHTPDALEKVLQTLSELPHRDLYCVFGCGGDRDISKRPIMGRIAVNYADVAVATSDNPRSEDPEKILEHVFHGMVQGGTEIHPTDWLLERQVNTRGSVIIESRKEAIRSAVSAAGKGDIVLIAGKGHEKYQLIGGKTFFFDDCLEAQEGMISWNEHHLGRALNKCVEGDLRVWFSGKIETDSRNVQPGDIFIALKGDNFDGHKFVGQAEAMGASVAVISERDMIPVESIIPRIVVKDTLAALGSLAHYRRKICQAIKPVPLVAITGSCGKTTVKEMCSAIFEAHWPSTGLVPDERVLKTKGNFNNLIGLPLSLLPLSVKHDAVILEMGMNRKGEIAELAAIASPDISCITNVHAAHLEELKDIYGVAAAKKELFDNTREDKLLIINVDDDMLAPCLAEYSHQHLTFGIGDDAKNVDVTASAMAIFDAGNVRFDLHIQGATKSVSLQVAGKHNVTNAVAAATIAYGAGVPIETAVSGLEAFRPVDKRMKTEVLDSGLLVLNDCYNANPASMEAGIDALVAMPASHKVAVLGDMLELGATSEEAHRAIGEKLALNNVHFVALYGDLVKNVLQGAIQAGMAEDCIRVFREKAEIASWVSALLDQGRLVKGDWLLVKGSRGMKMETVLDALKENN